MILEELKIQGKAKVPVTASLCGIPRIKPLGTIHIVRKHNLGLFDPLPPMYAHFLY